MKKYKEITQQIQTHKLQKLICDGCGKESNNDYDTDITSFNIEFGYGSKFDTETWYFDLCDECMERTFNEIRAK